DQETEEEADLPEPPELDVGKTLIAEPEPAAFQIAHDAQPVAYQRPGDDDERHPEQQVDEDSLSACFAPASDCRGEEEPGADPPHPDPDNRGLDVDVAQEVEGEDGRQIDAVEAAPVVIGMRHDRPRRDLQQEHSRDEDEIFARLALAWRQRDKPREERVHRPLIGISKEPLIDKQYGAKGEKREAEAGPGPNEGVG